MVLVGESDREYSCQDKDVEICIVSSSGTFVNSQQTSKEHIIPLLFVLFGPVCKTERVLNSVLVGRNWRKDGS